MFKDDVLANVLYIDLSHKKYWVERREDLFEKYLGGAGVAMFNPLIPVIWERATVEEGVR